MISISAPSRGGDMEELRQSIRVTGRLEAQRVQSQNHSRLLYK